MLSIDFQVKYSADSGIAKHNTSQTCELTIIEDGVIGLNWPRDMRVTSHEVIFI